MKFELKKSYLKSLFDKVTEVSTKAIKADFDQASRACIVAENDKLTFTATNGHIDYRRVLTPTPENGLRVIETGKVVAQSAAALQVAKAIGGSNSDAVIEVSVDSDSLVFRNTSAKLKEVASVETFQSCKSVDISKPKKPPHEVKFDVPSFAKWSKSVLPYTSKRGYKIKYQMLCVHFVDGKVRLIAGDGSRFGICMTPTTGTGDDAKLILPEDQVSIILSVIAESETVSFVWNDKVSCYISTSDGQEMFLRGIPDLDYIAYEMHAFKEDQARYVLDIPMEGFSSAVGLVGAVRDAELEKSGDFFHSAELNANCSTQVVTIKVTERRKAEHEVQSNIYKLEAGADDNWMAAYAHMFLQESARMSSDFIRFYYLAKNGIMIVRPVSVSEAKDEKGVPVANETADKSELRLFFASVKEKNSDE